MTTRVLVDSNFYIDRARRGLDPFAELAAADPNWEVLTCGMVMLEVLRGVIHPRALEQFVTAFSVMSFIPSNNAVWEKAWRVAWEMDRKGKTIPGQDITIAAHALHADAAVLTADHHFGYVPDLIVLDRLG